jgi:glucokinase
MSDRYTIGLDIGGTRVKAALVDREGRISQELNLPSSLEEGYQGFLTRVLKIIKDIREKAAFKPDGVGLAVAGLMNRDRSAVIDSPNCGVLIGHHLAGDIEQATGLPAAMENDANAMALGEGLCGAARDSHHYIAFTIGTGIGGAVVSGGRLVRGIDGGGCELGHVPIDIDGPLCGCGSNGCLEAFIGRTGLRSYIDQHHPHFSNTGLKELEQIARQGDEAARDIYAYLGRILGVGAAGLVNIFNPELLIIGGGVANAWELFHEALEQELQRRAFASYLASLKVKQAQLGNWAGVVGAAALVASYDVGR